MTISPLKLEMQQMAMEAKSIHPPATGQDVVSNFGDLLSNALGQVNALQKAQVNSRRDLTKVIAV